MKGVPKKSKKWTETIQLLPFCNVRVSYLLCWRGKKC